MSKELADAINAEIAADYQIVDLNDDGRWSVLQTGNWSRSFFGPATLDECRDWVIRKVTGGLLDGKPMRVEN